MDVFGRMVQCMETELNVKAKRVCLADEWSSRPPSEAGGSGLENFLSPEVANTYRN